MIVRIKATISWHSLDLYECLVVIFLHFPFKPGSYHELLNDLALFLRALHENI